MLLLLVAMGPQSRASAEPNESRSHPRAIVKLGIGVPGMPGAGVEVFVAEHWTAQLEAGTGLIGDYGAVSARWRPCWGCRPEGSQLALGLGAEATLILNGEGGRTGILATLLVEPSYTYMFSRHFGTALGLKLSLGPEWDFVDGEFLVVDLAGTILLYAGIAF